MTEPVPEQVDPPRRGLDRSSIVEAAIRSIDAEGLASLSMRRLGQELGFEAMSLYRHVSGREDLLAAVVQRILEPVAGRIEEGPIHSWQGYLQTMAHEVRRIALAHPAAFPLVASRHPAAPWLRPPLRSIELVEHFLAALTAHGFDDEQAVDVYKAFTTFLIGALLLEATAHGGKPGATDDSLDEGDAQIPGQDARIDLSTVPHVRRMRPRLSRDDGEREFEIGLEMLLDRIEREISQ